MKRIRFYIPCVLLTFLLVFSLMGTLVSGIACRVLRMHTYETVLAAYSMGTLSEETLTSRFTRRANTTGIPVEISMTGMDADVLAHATREITAQALDYITGRSDSFAPTMDFTQTDAALSDYLSSYAEENGYEQDAAYEEKLAQILGETHEEILDAADCYKFRLLYDSGYLETARHYAPLVSMAFRMLLILTGLLALALILCNKRQPVFCLYWIGLAAFIAGVLPLVPGIYLTATDYFAGFAVKDAQIFTAVVGLLRNLTKSLVTGAGCLAGGGVLGIIAFALLLRLRPEKD